jgi:hypothetical protein
MDKDLIKVENESQKKQKKKIIFAVKIILNIAIYVVLLLVLDFFFNLTQEAKAPYGNMYQYILPSVIVTVLIYTILFFLTKQTKKTNLIFSIILFVLAAINHVKILASGNPLFLTDISFIGNAGEIATLAFSVLKSFKTYIPLIALIGFFVVLNFISFKVNLKLELPKYKKRITSSVVIASIVLLVLFFAPIQAKDMFILKNIYKTTSRIDSKVLLSNIAYYKQYGVIGGLIENLLENRQYEPDGYDEEELKLALEEATGEENKQYGTTPNIFVIFSEAFWDVTQIEEVEFSVDVLQNFKELSNVGKQFNMISPSYGALSCNIEYELLTGGNLAYFSNGYIPFNSLYRDSKSTNYPSIINELNNNGYFTKVIFGKDYYKSEKQYTYLGADSYEDVDDEQYHKGYFDSDEYLTDLMIKELENKKLAKTNPENFTEEELEEYLNPTFYFTATIQNHLPFCNDKYNEDEFDVSAVSSTLPKDDTDFILSYAQGAYDADKQLKRFYDYIQTYDEDTIIVFLGDHLPRVTLGDDDVLSQCSYFNTGDDVLDYYRKYHTQGLILTNFEVEDTENVMYSSPDFLMTYVVNNMDIELSDYYKWLYDYEKALPSTNKYISISTAGDMYLNTTLPENLNEAFEFRRRMQYMMFNRKIK